MIGLIIGRFQPMHNGHVELIRKASNECEKIIIMIGSPNKIDENNPFSLETRKRVMKKILSRISVKNYEIFSLEDIPDDNKWVKYLEDNLPNFDAVYAGEEKDVELFSGSDHMIKVIGRVENISATKIRKLIRKNDDSWKNIVPEESIEEMEKVV